MDHVERARLKQLANDSVIATFGRDNTESRLALALESAVEEFEFIATGCDHCKYCDVHGEVEDDSIAVDVVELLRIHGAIKQLSQKLQTVYGTEDTEELQSCVDELGAELQP